MMFPHPLQLMMLGGAINAMQHADEAKYIEHLETCAQDLQRRLKSVVDHYQQLWEAYQQLEEHVRVVEGERDALQNDLDDAFERFHVIQTQFDGVRLEFQRFKENMETLVQKEAKRLEAYEWMKKFLNRPSEPADHFFTSEFTADHRQKLTEFLERLPD